VSPTHYDAITPGWRLVDVVIEGDSVRVSGIDPWEHAWTRESRTIVVAHPSYPHQRHVLDVWQVAGPDGSAIFAAGELSNGVWSFYVRES
jgi:nitrogen fixation protein FixH